MDDPAQARAYAEADFAAVNQGFVDRLRALFPGLAAGTIVDLGCGPADIALRLARALPAARVVGVDASPAMLELGRAALAAASDAPGRDAAARVELLPGRIPGLPLGAGSAAAVVSNSLLHHLPDPRVLWEEARRLAAPGAPILVMDLRRPESEAAARRIVDEAGCSDDPLLVRDFYASLLAAFTLDEVRAQLRAAGLAHLESAQVSERHLLVWGLAT
jgi:SAM-dependent methyltransferase